MSHTKITYVSYTEKNGFVWRKRTQGSLISISLQTRNSNGAHQRSLYITLRFYELEKVDLDLLPID